jgi:hypothetical protein
LRKVRKTVHFSVDDIGLRLRDASGGNGLFDVPFFAKLKEWHDKFDLRVTCYCYAMTEDWLISELSHESAPDFGRSKGWLKFGFHAKRDFAFADESGYEAGFELVNATIRRLGGGMTDTLRLHCWNASAEQKAFLRRKGVRVLLTQDDDGLPYGDDDTYTDCGLVHMRTRVRFEEMKEITPETLHIGREHIVAFTHEWCFDEQIDKIEEALRLYKDAGCGFVA